MITTSNLPPKQSSSGCSSSRSVTMTSRVSCRCLDFELTSRRQTKGLGLSAPVMRASTMCPTPQKFCLGNHESLSGVTNSLRGLPSESAYFKLLRVHIRFVQTWLPGGIQGSSSEALSFGETDGEGSGRSNDGPDMHSLRREVRSCQGLGSKPYTIHLLY